MKFILSADASCSSRQDGLKHLPFVSHFVSDPSLLLFYIYKPITFNPFSTIHTVIPSCFNITLIGCTVSSSAPVPGLDAE